MKNKSFKFSLDERVFILGKSGLCIIIGRGHMEFTSGGKINWYIVDGGHNGFYIENILITRTEAQALNRID